MLSSDEVKQAALAVGFDDCGVACADALTDEEYPLREWLRRGWHADLGYMERNVEMRMDPRILVPGAKSVICCVSAYAPPSPDEPAGGTAAYARTREYHKDIKQMLFALRERLAVDGKICCDTVPISDKHWAARAGLGWIGRHTLLVTPRWGTWVNLGEIVTTAECDCYDSDKFSISNSQSSICKTCGRCVDACPNQALAPEGSPMLNVARCTAYYTTHHQRELPADLDACGYTMGCDLCQLACPFNQNVMGKKK